MSSTLSRFNMLARQFSLFSRLQRDGSRTRRLLKSLFAVVALLIGTGFVAHAYQQPNTSNKGLTSRQDRWKKVDEHMKKGLPKSAVEELSEILKGAIADKAFPEAIKALGLRVVMESRIEGALPEEHITRLKKEMETAPPEMLPMLHALQAHFYWNYFQQNRWQFGQRTETASASDDFKTWDLKRLFKEIDFHFTKSLESAKELQSIPIASFDPLLKKGSVPDSYRPTVYDFLAHEALAFYASGEQAGARPQDAFSFDASTPALGSATDFLAWKPETTDTDSAHFRAIVLFQKLLAFHQSDKDKTAFLDADLARLQFCHAHAVGSEKDERIIAALKSFAERNADHERSSEARFRWASLLNGQNNKIDAKAVAQQGANTFPQSTGGSNCLNLIANIESKSISLSTERVWGDTRAEVRVTYRNLSKVYFRMVSLDWKDRLLKNRNSPSYLYGEDREKLLAATPAVAWNEELRPTEDYLDATHDVSIPKELKPGYYAVLASVNDKFNDRDNMVSVAMIWVSNLALLVNANNTDGSLSGFVLQNESGSPVASAQVTAYYTDNNQQEWKNRVTTTDANGRFEFGISQGSCLLIAEHAGNKIAIRDSVYTYSHNPQPAPSQSYNVFTDRSLYRPGQSIHYKGICLFADTQFNEYRVIPNADVQISFRDINGTEISSQKLRSNAFGSFSGTFEAPRDRGTGAMSLQVNGQHVAQIMVEEYKRPKFEVKMKPPVDSPKLNDKVLIGGVATSYTGTAIQGAKVRYRVTRTVRYPIWFSYCFPWRMPPDMGASQEIANGTVETKPDGTFEFPFVAQADQSIAEDTNPIFQYQVTADVTDTNGETRSGSSTMSAGYVAMEAQITVPEWLTSSDKIALTLNTTSLDGVSLASKGKLKIHRLQEPKEVLRPSILGYSRRPAPVGVRNAPRNRARPSNSAIQPQPDPASMATWATSELALEKEFDFTADSKREIELQLPRGAFRAVVETQDRFGKPVTAVQNFVVIDPTKKDLGVKVFHHFTAPKWKLEPGETFRAVWGTGYRTGRVYVELRHRGVLLQRFWSSPEQTQVSIEQKIDEEMRGGLSLTLVFVRENRVSIESRMIEVPWSNKELRLRWESFTSKLEPGNKKKFKLRIDGPKASDVVSEVVATMYDASLDAYFPHSWLQRFNVFRNNYTWSTWLFQNTPEGFGYLSGNFSARQRPVRMTYRSFPDEFQSFMNLGRQRMYGAMPGGVGAMRGGGGMASEFGAVAEAAPASAMMKSADGLAAFADAEAPPGFGGGGGGGAPPPPASNKPNLENVSPRKNLQETAFFVPHVMQSPDGGYEIEFTVPEALTSWRLFAFAHDKELRSGFLEDKLTTSKDLMVQPNPPRFLREGDLIEFSVKVSNASDRAQSGSVALKLFDAITDRSIDDVYRNAENEKTFELGKGESKSLTWALHVPDGVTPVLYRAIGGTADVSDGEEGYLPVLSRRILVTESMPLPIRGQSEKDFEFEKLLESSKSTTLQHQSLTVQMVSQPAWYAVLALPYLMEYPHECSEQTFNRYYANRLASHIAQSDPKIRRVFDTWKNLQPAALDSPLEKNQDLKSVMIQETPWLRDSQKESASRRNVALLFDQDRLNAESERTIKRLVEMQLPNGQFPWFAGGPENPYLTLYITTGFGRLRQLGVAVDVSLAQRSLTGLDAWVHKRYRDILNSNVDPEKQHIDSTIAIYLYGRSFFLQDQPVAEEHATAVDYWKRQAQNHWLALSRQCQAQIAVGLNRWGDIETPGLILKSILEHSSNNEEMGMFWRDTERSWWWYDAPIETQAMMIEALSEVTKDAKSVEDCKVWLLKQKQTQDWKTTKATADAVYALLLRGDKLLASDSLVEVQLGDTKIVPQNVEAGTGFYESKFLRSEVRPDFGKVHVSKKDAGVSWGSVHWQYLEDVSKVTPYEGTPLTLEKQLFVKKDTKSGPVLEPVNGPIAIGDELVSRIVLRTDRDMEYVHLKDQRGSGTEPVNVLSGYKMRDGLFYYESTRDTATHFFIDYLRKGTYVFEYSVRVQHAGKYPSGIASIQCMYAPEFNGHSQSVVIEVSGNAR